MVMRNFSGLSAPGMVADLAPQDLPANVWTLLRNTRCEDTGLKGIQSDLALSPDPPISPQYIAYADDSASGPLYVYAGTDKAYALLNNVHTEITRTAGVYTGGKWNSANFNGLLILNNGVDVPQVWGPVNPATKLVNLPNWPAGTTAKVVAAYLNYLVALDVTKSGTRYDQMVKWSHYADPGAVPSSWDVADTTKDAGETVLAKGPDPLIDCRLMGSTLVLYKRDSIWLMRYVGGGPVFRFDPAVETFGALSQRCVVSLPDGSHAVLGRGDFCIFNGQGIRSILNNRMRKWLFSRLDGGNVDNVFLAHNLVQREVLICIPLPGASYADLALVWNYDLDALYLRELPSVNSIAYGEIQLDSGDTFDAATGTVDSDTFVYDSWPYNPANRMLVMASAPKQKILVAESKVGAEVTPGAGIVERTELPLDADSQGTLRVDFTTRKLVTAVWPRIVGATCPCVDVYVGAQESPDDPVNWEGPYEFNPGVDEFVATWISGKLISVRFEFPQGTPFSFQGYGIECSITGKPI